MVARGSSGSRPRRHALSQLLHGWRSALQTVVTATLEAARAARCELGAVVSGDLAPLSRWPYVTLALGCVTGGALARLALAAPGQDRIAAATAGAAALGWAVGRLGIMTIVLGTDRRSARRTRSAWVAGTVVWAGAVVPLAAFAAWLASGAISYVALGRTGEPAIRARRAIVAAWGIQAAVTLVSWIAVNAWFASLLS